MKCLITIGFMLCCLSVSTVCPAQPAPDWSAIDRHARAAPKKTALDLDALHDYLIRPCRTPIERLRSFYSWMAQHIQYDQKVIDLQEGRLNKSLEDILQRRKAVCMGYSQLLQALCEKSGIPGEIISGYVRTGSGSPQLEVPDHTWNAVLIEEEWRLIDPTWAASHLQRGGKTGQATAESYFFADPVRFAENHLPEVTMWQLMPCPLSLEGFQNMESRADSSDRLPCISFADSIRAFRQMPPMEQILHLAKSRYRFNPSDTNGRQLGQGYMDYFIFLSEKEDQLQERENMEQLLDLHDRMFRIAETARQYIRLFDWQKDYLARTHLNHAVALSKTLNDPGQTATQLQQLQEMQTHLLQGELIFKSLKPTIFTGQALEQCQEYLKYTRAALAQLKQ